MHTLPSATLAAILSPSNFSSTIALLTAKRGWLHGAVFAAACLPAMATAVPTYTAIDLGEMGGSAAGNNINASGQVVGFSATINGVTHALLSSGGTMTDLGTLGGSSSFGSGINDNGQVTGWSNTTGGPEHAFLYSDGVMKDLGTLGGPRGSSKGIGINASGQVTGWTTTTHGGSHAFLYSDGVMKDLGTLGGQSSRGWGINDNGQVTGASLLTGNAADHAFLYSDGVMKDLGTLGGAYSAGYDINASGQVTGWSYMTKISGGGATHAFLYSDGVMNDLGTLGGHNTYGTGINASGQVVGYSADGADYDPFLYSGGLMYNLDDLLVSGLGTKLAVAYGINDSGQVMVWGWNGHTYILTPDTVVLPVPEPASLLLLATALGSLLMSFGGRRAARHQGDQQARFTAERWDRAHVHSL